MSSAASYDYAIVRIVPRPDREEFLNAGVILSCPGHDFLQAKVELPATLLASMAPNLDLEAVGRHLEAIPRICGGDAGSGPIGSLDLRARFHWLTAIRSSVIQTSPAHAGTTEDPSATLTRLFLCHVAR